MRIGSAVCLLATALAYSMTPLHAIAAGPSFSANGPDAVAYGAPNYPVGRRGAQQPQANMVGTYSAYDRVYPYHRVARARVPSNLRRASQEIALRYEYRGASYSIDDYLERNPATGLLIARGDEILFEHYRYARTDADRLVSHSMAKTVTAMLLGIAIAEGAVRSLDDPAALYVPALAGTEYGATPIRAPLHMSSGVAFREVYDSREADNARLSRALFGAGSRGPARAVAMFDVREAPPGTRFNYAGADTEVLGLVIAGAVHMPLSHYLESRVWKPMGAEADASWIIDAADHEAPFCCISATLRDWARFALLLAHDGRWNGRQIIPRQWLIDATTVTSPDSYLAPGRATPYYGYGYQLWILPGPRRQFALLGLHGQAIFVDPRAKLILVHTAVRLKPSNDPQAAELRALWRTLVRRYRA